MVADVRLATKDMNGISDGEIPIFDMAGFSLRHLTKVVMSSLRTYMRYTQVRSFLRGGSGILQSQGHFFNIIMLNILNL